MTRQLRDYQQEAVQAVRAEWADGITRTAVVHATGLGKTDIIASMVGDEVVAGGRALILTHRYEIMGQLADRCRLYAPSVPVGIVQAERNEARRPVTVAMVPTLAARLRAIENAPTDRERTNRRARLPLRPSFIVCDEAHHAAAATWMQALRWAGAFDHVKTLGTTATLVRGDRRGLGDVWESVADERDIGWGIEHGYLVKPRGRAVVTDHVDLEHAKVSKGDYQDNELGEMVEQDTAQIVKAWIEHASERITVAFCPTVASAGALAAEFAGAGVPTGIVVGTTPMEGRGGRKDLYGQLERGELRVLCSVMVPTEGWDCPPVSCILQCRPTKLAGLYQQMIGRGLRPADGKTDCLVLDVVGASRFQRLATLVDLHKSAEYDNSDLERAPCPDCGLPRSGDYIALCQCTKDEDEAGERSSDRRRLIGPASYEDVDLFKTSELSWLFTKGGIRFLPAGDRIAVLWPNEDDTYAPGHCFTRRTRHPDTGQWGLHGECISPREDLDYGRRLAESWALQYAPTVAKRNASWRKRGGRPSTAQEGFARSLGIPSPETMTKPRLSDEISIALASEVLD